MKARFLLLFVYIFFSYNELFSQCGGGELYFRVQPLPTTYTIDVTITTSEYSWFWDFVNNKPLPTATFQSSFTGETCTSYLAPKRGSGNDVIPWGVFSINIIGRNQAGDIVIERNFTLDLRDEYWSFYGYIYPGVDTFIEFNTEVNPTITIAARQNGINNTYSVNNGSLFRIWELWETSEPPLQSNFKIPVTLQNRVEGETFDFGYLKVGTKNINSGESEEFKDGIPNSVENGTLETTVNIERKYSFKWTKSDNVSSVEGQNFLSRSSVLHKQIQTCLCMTAQHSVPAVRDER